MTILPQIVITKKNGNKNRFTDLVECDWQSNCV